MGVICCACDAMLALRVNVNGERRALVAKRAKMHVSAQRDFGALRKRDATPLPETSPQSVPAGQTQVGGSTAAATVDCSSSTSTDLTHARPRLVSLINTKEGNTNLTPSGQT